MSNDKRKNHPKKTPPSDSPVSKIGHQQENTNKPQKRFWRDWEPMEKFTLIIAVFTILYSIVTYGLYGVTKDTLIINKRAFLYCKEVNIIPNTTKDGKIDPAKSNNIAILWVNSGETPARKVIISVNYCFRKGELPNDFSYPGMTGQEQPIMMVSPKSEITSLFALPNSIFNNLEGNSLFIYGEVSYIDVFNVSHKTQFCQKYVTTRFNMKEAASPDKYMFSPCGKHDCCDDDCPKYYGSNSNCGSPPN